jgi:hypothetical protein
MSAQFSRQRIMNALTLHASWGKARTRGAAQTLSALIRRGTAIAAHQETKPLLSFLFAAFLRLAVSCNFVDRAFWLRPKAVRCLSGG